MNNRVCFARDKLPGLVSNVASNATSNAINKFVRRTSQKGVVSVRKKFTVSILNKDMDDIIKIGSSLEYPGILIDGATEAAKYEIKNMKVDLLVIC